jgi:TatD DNase family protein
MKFIDIHSHLGFEDYGNDVEEVIKRMHENGVATITIGTGLESSKEAVRIAEENENIWACIGNHPDENSKESFNEEEYEKLVKSPKVVAIGECGLDYSKFSGGVNGGLSLRRSEATGKGESSVGAIQLIKEKQKEEFIKQIEFSIKHNKPLMLHIRDFSKGTKSFLGGGTLNLQKGSSSEKTPSAYDDAYEILNSKFNIPNSVPRGNLHFFTSNITNAKRFIDLGFTISFPGLITYMRDFDKIIKNIPLDKIHTETDSPYVAPVPHRGERNEPSYVIEMYKKIAEIRGEDFESVRLQLLKNAKNLFNL